MLAAHRQMMPPWMPQTAVVCEEATKQVDEALDNSKQAVAAVDRMEVKMWRWKMAISL